MTKIVSRRARASLTTALVASLLCAPSTGEAQQTLPYDPEEPVPLGYHVEKRPRYGLLITGAGLSATAIGCFVYASSQRKEELRSKESQEFPTESTSFYALGTLFTLAAVPVLLVGLTKKQVLVADPPLQFAPLVGKGFGGIGVGGTF